MKCWCGGTVGKRHDGTGCLASVYHDWRATGRPEQVNVLYLAGPMSGYEDCNYPTFHRNADLLRQAGYVVHNPAEVGARESSYEDLLRKDLKLLLECDGVAVLENWWESNGARNEVNQAAFLKMPVRPVLEWVDLAAEEGGRHGNDSHQNGVQPARLA